MLCRFVQQVFQASLRYCRHLSDTRNVHSDRRLKCFAVDQNSRHSVRARALFGDSWMEPRSAPSFVVNTECRPSREVICVLILH
jgi:hypothetical protein